ncbi:MAG: SOS response-associated peptidase [Gemmatimonadota bacterium]|jgi:putative SOS response-associated peptidase YedK
MCGRYTLTAPADDLAAEFGVEVPADYEPRYNIAPQQPVAVIGPDADGRPRLAFLRWGLVPWWSSPEAAEGGPINARAETLSSKPTFRDAFRERRCLIVADGFYEWKREGAVRVPFRFHLRGGGLLAFAGLWERWEKGAEPLYTCAIVTTAASDAVASIHDRMPAILPRGARERWIDPGADATTLRALLRPLEDPGLVVDRVSRLVNSVANDSPDCIEPA